MPPSGATQIWPPCVALPSTGCWASEWFWLPTRTACNPKHLRALLRAKIAFVRLSPWRQAALGGQDLQIRPSAGATAFPRACLDCTQLGTPGSTDCVAAARVWLATHRYDNPVAKLKKILPGGGNKQSEGGGGLNKPWLLW
jgi:hypothetical protein